MVKVTCQVENQDSPAKMDVRVHNHLRSNELVEIEIKDGERFSVKGAELIAAIENCMNTNER